MDMAGTTERHRQLQENRFCISVPRFLKESVWKGSGYSLGRCLVDDIGSPAAHQWQPQSVSQKHLFASKAPLLRAKLAPFL